MTERDTLAQGPKHDEADAMYARMTKPMEWTTRSELPSIAMTDEADYMYDLNNVMTRFTRNPYAPPYVKRKPYQARNLDLKKYESLIVYLVPHLSYNSL